MNYRLSILYLLTALLPLSVFGESNVSRQYSIEKQYLILPISNMNQRTTITMTVDGKLVHRFEVSLADNLDAVDWFSFFDVSEYAGKTLDLNIAEVRENSEVFQLIRNSAEVPRREPLYQERFRPQLRFSQMQGWNNDPNGMVFHDGKFHFFWQSNPVGLQWGNMYWGHAVSSDLVHWAELPLALRPFGNDVPQDRRAPSMAAGQCFSGSANVTHNPVEKDTLLALFTDTARGESLAVSHDSGTTWTYADFNPVVAHQGRDPQLIWYEEERCWILTVYDEVPREGQEVARNIDFYRSSDLRTWEKTCTVEGFYECPQFFRLAVDGNPQNTRWVLWAADAQYKIGSFDGRTFTPEHDGKFRLHYGSFYASQCYANAPNGRVIQVGWAQFSLPFDQGPVFNQGFTLPLELSLRTTPEGIRLFAEPVEELNELRTESQTLSCDGVTTKSVSLDTTKFGDGQLYDILVTFQPTDAPYFALIFGQNRIGYDAANQQLGDVPAKPNARGEITFRVLTDRPLYETCVNSGAAYRTTPRADMGEKFSTITLEGAGTMTVHALKSIHNH